MIDDRKKKRILPSNLMATFSENIVSQILLISFLKELIT